MEQLMSTTAVDHWQAARRISRSLLAINGALLLTTLLALFAVWRIGELSRATIIDHARDRLYVQELRLLLQQAAALDRAFLLTGDAEAAEEYLETEEQFYRRARVLDANILSPEGQRLLDAAVAEKREHTRAVALVMNIRMATDDLNEAARAFSEYVRPRNTAVDEALSELLSHKTEVLNEAGDATMRVIRIAEITLIVVGLVNVLLCVAMRRLTRRTLGTLNDYSSELLRAIRGRDEFLAVASHELRTPLSVLKLQTQMLERRLSSGDRAATNRETVDTFTRQVTHSVNNLANLVSRMLDIVNITRGELRLSKEKVNLNELTRDIIERMAPVFADAHCDLHYDDGAPAVGCWDKTRLEQVISNLLVNIVRHAPGHPATVTVDAENGMARLVVEDRGPGVAEIDRARIFERFERASFATDGTGMGLGLAVSREIIRAHGGRIWIENREGPGARFVVEVPLTERGEACDTRS
jgi:signal transduction histidine kinase